MGLEALFGACEHCKLKRKTEVVDIFISGPDNSLEGIHKKLGFPFFECRIRICKACLKAYEKTDKLFQKLNSGRWRKWRHKTEGASLYLRVSKILIIYLDRGSKGKNPYKILTRKNKAAQG